MSVQSLNNGTNTIPGFTKFAAFVQELCGIVLTENKAAMIEARLKHRLGSLELRSLEDYYNFLRMPGGQAEISYMISALTTNVTDFFREPHHFETVAKEFENFHQTQLHNDTFRVWSCGCSRGHEAYSIAIALLSSSALVRNAPFKILGTDIDTDVLLKAKRGIFIEQDARKLMEKEKIDRFFSRVEKDDNGTVCLAINSNVRETISFNKLNIFSEWPMHKKFDAIFCRNVVIYFDESSQRELWPRFHGLLKTGGLMFVGHSERIQNPLFELVGATTYRTV